MRRIFNQARTLALSRTAKDTYILTAGNSLAAVLAIIFTILAARFLEPERWGIVAAVISFIIIVEAVGDLGLGSSLFRFVSSDWGSGNKQRAEHVLKVIFLLRVVTAAVVLFALTALSGILAPLVFGLDEPLLVIFAGLAVFGYLVLDFQITSFQAKQKWILSSSFIVFTNLLRIILLFWLIATNRVSTVGVLVIFAASPIASFLASLVFQRIVPTWKDDWGKITEKIAPFSGWLGVNRIASAAASRLDVLLLLVLAGAYQTGIYSAAKQLIIGVPLVVGSVATVVAPRFAAKKGKDLVIFFKKTVWLSVLLSVGLVFGVLLAPLVIQLFGPKYQSSTAVLQILFLAHIPFVLSMPAVNVLIYAFGRTNIIALIALVQLPLVYFGSLYTIPVFGVNGPALIIGLVNLSTAVVTYMFALHHLKGK